MKLMSRIKVVGHTWDDLSNCHYDKTLTFVFSDCPYIMVKWYRTSASNWCRSYAQHFNEFFRKLTLNYPITKQQNINVLKYLQYQVLCNYVFLKLTNKSSSVPLVLSSPLHQYIWPVVILHQAIHSSNSTLAVKTLLV